MTRATTIAALARTGIIITIAGRENNYPCEQKQQRHLTDVFHILEF